METGERDSWLPAFMEPVVWGTGLQLSERFPKAGKCRTDVRKREHHQEPLKVAVVKGGPQQCWLFWG